MFLALILNERNFDATVSRASELKTSKKKFCNGPKSGPWMKNFKTKAVGAECVCACEERVRKRIKCYNGRRGGHSAGIA